MGRRPDRARVARGLGGAARGRRLARRDRRAAPDPQLVLPPGVLAGEPPGPAPPEEARPRGGERRDSLRAGARPRGARLLERLPRRVRDGPLPPGADARGRGGDRARGRGARLRGSRRRVPARRRARAEAPAQADARRNRGADHRGARRARRPDRADDAGRRLGSGQPCAGRAALLVGRLARCVPDVGGARSPGGRSALRRRELRRRGGVPGSPQATPHRACRALNARPPRRGARAPGRGASPRRGARPSASRASRRPPRRGRCRRSRGRASRRRRPARS